MSLAETRELPNDGQSKPTLKSVRTAAANQEIIAFCEKSLTLAKNARVNFERQWYMNMAFYFGRQNAQWRSSALNANAQLWEPPAPPWRVRLIINKCRRIVRKELAKSIREKPRGFVMPQSSDDKDTMAARAAEQILDHLQRELLIGKQLRRAMWWTLITGTGFMKDWWSPRELDSDGQEGKICIEPVTPFHLFVSDLAEEELENQAFVIHVLGKDPHWVKSLFGKQVPADSSGPAGGVLDQRFLSSLGISGQNQKSLTAVKEAWFKPGGKFKDGAQVIWAGSEILHIEEGWYYEHGQYPFTKFEHIMTGRFYGESTLVDVIPLQREYNRSCSQIIESKNRMSKPQLVAPKGAVDPKKLTSEPGLLIEYTPGFTPPSPLPLQTLPSYVMQNIDRVQADMNDVASQHEISQGQTPPGVTAATAISYLQEEDDSVLATTISSIEEGVERIGRHFLSYVAQFWEAERTVRVVGDNGALESFIFSKADIKGNTDFRVEAGSAMPISRAAKQAFIMELSDRQMIDPNRALKYLGLAETGKLWEESQLDARQAQRENIKMGMGAKVNVNTWDNHEVHVMEHDAYRKKQEYELLPQQAKIMFEYHVQMHKNIMRGAMGQVPGQLPDPMMQLQMGGMGQPTPQSTNNPESPVQAMPQPGPVK